MRVLVACEFSGIVRDAFIAKGHDAWSCDLLPTERPGHHLQCDVLTILDQGWDLMIAHPPCQYLSWAGNVWLAQPGRSDKRRAALEFFLQLICAPIPKKCIENPPGYPCQVFKKPDQIIQPWQFGHAASKKTCFWLAGLPLLLPTKIVALPAPYFDGKRNRHWTDRVGGGSEAGKRARSRTFQGVADAMAEQWSC